MKRKGLTIVGHRPVAENRSPRPHIPAKNAVLATARTALVWALVVTAFLFAWFQRELLLLAFAGVLAAVFLSTLTGWLRRVTHLPGALAYTLTLVLLAGLAAGVVLFLGPRVSQQASAVVAVLPDSLHRLEQPLQAKPWGQDLIGRVHEVLRTSSIGSKLPDLANSLLESIVDIVVVAVIGFFAALNPRGYRHGIVVLIPEQRREGLRRILGILREQLKWWLFGQMFAMAVLGVGTGIGLWLLGVKMAWIFALITACAVFVPYAGTVIAGIPSVLMALEKGPRTALWVLLFYTALHVLEGYILTPFIQKKAVRLPPVLTVLSQFLMWNVAGVLGVALAAPLTTAGLVLLKEGYLHVPSDKEIV